jgi:hypothetical protein
MQAAQLPHGLRRSSSVSFTISGYGRSNFQANWALFAQFAGFVHFFGQHGPNQGRPRRVVAAQTDFRPGIGRHAGICGGLLVAAVKVAQPHNFINQGHIFALLIDILAGRAKLVSQ